MGKIFFLLMLTAALCCAVKRRRQYGEWEYKAEADKVNTKGCANLTTVLDNWKFAIMTQFKNLLLHDHHTVLPDYGRIKSLSDALDDLYKEFNTLKERLGELTTKFDGIESFVDEMRAGRHQLSARSPQSEIKRALPPLVSPELRRYHSHLKGKKPAESSAVDSP